MPSMTGDPCERCEVGTLRTYTTRTLTSCIVRYLHCGVCGHKPADNKLIVPLHKARRIIGNRVSHKMANVVRDPLPGAPLTGENATTMNDDPKHLLTGEETATRLGVGVRELRAAVARGLFPAPVRLVDDGPELFRWLEVVAWLEGGCVPQWGRIQRELRHYDRCYVRSLELGIDYEHPYGDPLKGE